jgi:tRNA pseudouridine55 synthase
MNLSGVLPVNKPSGVTSHDVIQRLRRILNIRRIGHTGTLDPSASGVLLACVGKATKVVQFLTEYDKEYEAVIKLGITTETYDGEGKITETKEGFKTSPHQIRKVIDSFKGKIWQTPPLHSAIKYRGKKLYQYARAKEKVEIKKREVNIRDIEVLDINLPLVKLKINCSKGTYVRSLAFDVGQKLGCGAYLFSLRRTRVGPFKLQEALDLEKISQVEDENKIQDILFPIEKALGHLPSVVVKEGFAERVRHGVPLAPSSILSIETNFDQDQTISIKDGQKNIIAIGRALSSAKNFLDLDYKSKLFEYVRVI